MPHQRRRHGRIDSQCNPVAISKYLQIRLTQTHIHYFQHALIDGKAPVQALLQLRYRQVDFMRTDQAGAGCENKTRKRNSEQWLEESNMAGTERKFHFARTIINMNGVVIVRPVSERMKNEKTAK